MEAAARRAILRFFAGEAWRPKGELYEQSATGGAVYTVRRPLGVVGLITPVELPGRDPGLEDGARADLRQHGRDEARAGGAADRAPPRARASRRPACPPASSTSSSAAAPRSARRSSSHPQVRAISFTGSVAVGEQVRDRGDRARQARPARARRPEPADRDGRRRPRPRRRGRLRRRLLVGRPEVHGHPADLRPGRRLRRVPRAAARADRARRRRRPGRPGDRGRPDREREAARRGARRHRARARRRAAPSSPAASALDDDAYLLAPTVFEGVGDDAFLSCEEVFGPVTSLYRFDDLDEAIRRANAVAFGLSASIFTSEPRHRAAVRERARGRDPARELADRRRRRARPVRRDQGLRLRPARAGPRGDGVLHGGRDRLPGCLSAGSSRARSGCIGAWTCATLVREGQQRHRLRPRRQPRPAAADRDAAGDRRDRLRPRRHHRPRPRSSAAFEDVTHVVHLAALQVPFVREQPGARRAGERDRHGQRLRGGEGRGAADDRSPTRARPPSTTQEGHVAPKTLYGVFKLANEGTARIYADENGVASIGLRPFTVYGPGRDQGLTAAPTLAIAAASAASRTGSPSAGGRSSTTPATSPARSSRRRAPSRRRRDVQPRRPVDRDHRLRRPASSASCRAPRSPSTRRRSRSRRSFRSPGSTRR